MDKGEGLALRPAAMEDAELLFTWANDPDVRRNSLHSESISRQTHIAWLEKNLADDNVDISILMDAGEPVGQIRFVVEGDTATVNYSVDTHKRGIGYGAVLLELGCGALRRRKPDVCRLRAVVRAYNIASQRVFENNGFMLGEERAGCFVFYKDTKDGTAATVQEKIKKNVRDGVLVLTNNRNALRLAGLLAQRGERVEIYSDPIDAARLDAIQPRYVISYNYMHMIPLDAIQYMRGNMCNIHISVLPWNRGADPNFWSFVNDTPKGVSIHLVDAGLDTGDLLAQKEMTFDEGRETFKSSYAALHNEAVSLFMENWNDICHGKITPRLQPTGGSLHKHKEFLTYIQDRSFSYDMKIADFKREAHA